jgi:hypothetical protein
MAKSYSLCGDNNNLYFDYSWGMSRRKLQIMKNVAFVLALLSLILSAIVVLAFELFFLLISDMFLFPFIIILCCAVYVGLSCLIIRIYES